jgi:hypothetical protein
MFNKHPGGSMFETSILLLFSRLTVDERRALCANLGSFHSALESPKSKATKKLSLVLREFYGFIHPIASGFLAA